MRKKEREREMKEQALFTLKFNTVKQTTDIQKSLVNLDCNMPALKL